MVKRLLDYRETWDVKIDDGLHSTANYYPVNTAIAIIDKDL